MFSHWPRRGHLHFSQNLVQLPHAIHYMRGHQIKKTSKGSLTHHSHANSSHPISHKTTTAWTNHFCWFTWEGRYTPSQGLQLNTPSSKLQIYSLYFSKSSCAPHHQWKKTPHSKSNTPHIQGFPCLMLAQFPSPTHIHHVKENLNKMRTAWFHHWSYNFEQIQWALQWSEV